MKSCFKKWCADEKRESGSTWSSLFSERRRKCWIVSKRISRTSSMVHHGRWCTSPPSSTYRAWDKFNITSIFVSWIYFQVTFNAKLLVECLDCSKVDYRGDICSSSMGCSWFYSLSLSRIISPCPKSFINKSQRELKCVYWLSSFVPFLSLKPARLPILITTQNECSYMLLYNIINCNIRYHWWRVLETRTTDRTTLVFLEVC